MQNAERKLQKQKPLNKKGDLEEQKKNVNLESKNFKDQKLLKCFKSYLLSNFKYFSFIVLDSRIRVTVHSLDLEFDAVKKILEKSEEEY